MYGVKSLFKVGKVYIQGCVPLYILFYYVSRGEKLFSCPSPPSKSSLFLSQWSINTLSVSYSSYYDLAYDFARHRQKSNSSILVKTEVSYFLGSFIITLLFHPLGTFSWSYTVLNILSRYLTDVPISTFNNSAVIPSLPAHFKFFKLLIAGMISSFEMYSVLICFIGSKYSSSLMLIGLSGIGLFSTSSKCSFHLFLHSFSLLKMFRSLSFITDGVLFLSFLSVRVIQGTIYLYISMVLFHILSLSSHCLLPSLLLLSNYLSISFCHSSCCSSLLYPFLCISPSFCPSLCPICSSLSYVLSLYVLLLKSMSLY